MASIADREDHSNGRWSCSQCPAGRIDEGRVVCSLYSDVDRDGQAENRAARLLEQGRRMEAVCLLVQFKGWTINEAKRHCDGVASDEGSRGRSRVDKVIERLATSGDRRDYVHAIREARMRAKWGLKCARAYVELLYPPPYSY